MKKTTKAIALLAASTMLAVSLTACGTPANTVFSADDLKGKKIGAQLGTTGYIYAGDVEDATVEPYNKGADAVQALKQGKLDAVIIDSEPAKAFVAKNDTLKILDDPFAEEEYAIAYKKGNDELGQKLDDALTKLKEDGTLDEIVSHWIGDNADQKSYTPDDSVERDGTLVMATNAEFPPYESVDGDTIVGVDVDMMQAVCDEIGMELKVENMEFDSLIVALQNGQVDAVIAGMTVTDERAEAVDFSTPYYTATQVMVVKDGSDITKASDMEGKKICVIQGYTGETCVKDLGYDYEAFKKGTEAIMELVNDKCDVVVIDSATAQKYVADNDGLKIVEDNDAFDSEEYAIAVQKGNTELLDKINTAIEKLISDGKVSEYAAKYTDADAE